MSSVAKHLADLGIVLPVAAAPVANYVPFVRTGNVLTVSGQLPFGPDGVMAGKLGGGVSIEDGQKAARQCALGVIAQIQAAVGNLDNVVRIVRLGGFINCTPDFIDAPKVMNGASDLMVEVFGDKGRHARSTIGVAALPANASVEVEATVEIA
jgi:enamine deaminase RidA (YjgF/YER057c/UK114 family)